jgi:hypothetical protein
MDLGDRVFDALARLGWDLDIADDGTITAHKEGAHLVGQLQPNGGPITWPDAPVVDELVQQARILDLRARALHARQEREHLSMPTGVFMPGAEDL